MSEKFVIIGNGITAVTAAKSIRKKDTDSPIIMYGKEGYYPYNRIRLSKGFLNTIQEEMILLQKKEWYEDNNITLHTKSNVESLHVDEKEIELDDGSRVNYTKLLIASGASNTVPNVKGIDLKGVFTLKGLDDANSIIKQASTMDNILIVGGGIQGLETAWILSQMEKKVTLIELQSRLMPKQLDEDSSHILKSALESFGVTVLLDETLQEIHSDDDGWVSSFTTANGNCYKCGGVLYSIGIKPNISMLHNTSVETNWGVIVNESMETNIENIFAAGDVAELHGNVFGLWNIAIEQGKVAGENMVGEKSTYSHLVPLTRLSAYNLSLFSMGDVDDNSADTVLHESSDDDSSYKKIYIKENKVVGAIMLGDITASPILKKAIEKEKLLSPEMYTDACISDFIGILKEID